jgi:hypothetical protein
MADPGRISHDCVRITPHANEGWVSKVIGFVGILDSACLIFSIQNSLIFPKLICEGDIFGRLLHISPCSSDFGISFR